MVLTVTVNTVLNISTVKTYRLEQQVENSRNDDGLGIAAGFGNNETYSVVQINKL